MLNIHIEARAKCPRHPDYDPATQGQRGIVGACGACGSLLDLYDACQLFERICAGRIRDFDSQGAPDPGGHYVSPLPGLLAGSAHFRYEEG